MKQHRRYRAVSVDQEGHTTCFRLQTAVHEVGEQARPPLLVDPACTDHAQKLDVGPRRESLLLRKRAQDARRRAGLGVFAAVWEGYAVRELGWVEKKLIGRERLREPTERESTARHRHTAADRTAAA